MNEELCPVFTQYMEWLKSIKFPEHIAEFNKHAANCPQCQRRMLEFKNQMGLISDEDLLKAMKEG